MISRAGVEPALLNNDLENDLSADGDLRRGAYVTCAIVGTADQCMRTTFSGTPDEIHVARGGQQRLLQFSVDVKLVPVDAAEVEGVKHYLHLTGHGAAITGRRDPYLGRNSIGDRGYGGRSPARAGR